MTKKRVFSLLMLVVFSLMNSMEMMAGPDTRQVPSAWTNVRFNNDVRYSQWIINSRINDFYANSTHVSFGKYSATGVEEEAPIIVVKNNKTVLDYVPGLVAKAIVENVKLNAAHSWAAPWYYSMKSFGDTYYNAVTNNGTSGKSQDDLNGVKMFFALKDLTASGAKYENSTTNGHCISVMGDARTGLNNLNKNYIIGGANSGVSEDDAKALGMYGGWFHKDSYKDQMWCDGLYMGPALLAQLINEYGDYTQINTNAGEDDWDLITRLFTISWNQLYDSNTGLLYHAFTANPGDIPSAAWEGISNTDPKVYHSAAFWGRACGWYFLALVDILEQMDKAGKSNTTNYTTLKGYLNSLAAGLANYQDAETGCWYQVLDEKDNHLEGNYLESSCTAIFTAAYLKGMRLGYYTADYATVAQKAYEGCVNQFMMFADDGTAQLVHCCASAGLGGSSNRSGSRSYYITGYNNIYEDVIQRNTYTEGKVLGGFILAATEYERMYQSDKAILFSTDLKDSYSLENGGEITIEAFGADDATIAYQWYKDGEQVEGATSATIAPAASGSYYCEATSGNTTIASSAATVTVTGAPTVKYAVKFYDGDAQFGETQNINEGETVSAPTSNPAKEGYTFKGWGLYNGSTAKVLFPYEVWADVNFYAVWSEDAGGGSGEDEEIYSATATATLTVDADASNQEITSSNADISGGKLYVYNGQSSDIALITTQKSKVCFAETNGNTFFKVVLDKALKADDRISSDILGKTDATRGLWLTTATSRPGSAPTATLSVTNSTSSDAWMTSSDYLVKENDGICGQTTFYIYRATGNSTYFTNFTITREGQVIGDDITLDAATDYENFDDYVGEGKNVTFKRSFTADNWSTLVLPFSASAEQVASAFGETCKIAKIKSMSVTGGKGEIRLTDVSEITANEPVLVMITPNATDEYVFEGVTVVAPTSVVSTSEDSNIEMHGVYKTTGYTQISHDSYFLSGGKFYDWSYMNAMSPFSAYLLPVGENKPSSLSISMEETGIENVNGNVNVNGNDNVNWNLAGQRVAEGYKGIKIVKGKKVF